MTAKLKTRLNVFAAPAPWHSNYCAPARQSAIRFRGTVLAVFAVIILGRCVRAQTVEARPAAPETPAETAKTLGDAEDLWIEGSYEEAVQVYEALSKEPKHALKARLGLTRCRTQTGKYAEALAELESFEAAESAERQVLLGQLHRVTGGYEAAIRHAREAIRLNKKEAAGRRLLAETLELLGRREEAIDTYRWFEEQVSQNAQLPRNASWVSDVAVGFLRYSVLTRNDVARRTKHVLNDMLQPAYERIDRTYWPARITAADLLRERYNNSEEDGSLSDYHAALRINKNLPQAYVGIGEVALEGWNFEEVEKRAETALIINPNDPPALHLLAKKFLLERRYSQAKEVCDRALTINPHDIIALSLSAAASACRFDAEGVQQMAERVAAINPRPAAYHRILGDALSGIRQYADSEREYHKAIEFEPTDANARTELGMMYMQWGVESKAREALEAAWALDSFNERTHFTLEVLEQLEKLAQVETEHFIIKFDPQHDPGIGEFAAVFLEDMYASVTGDYGTTLAEKTVIEVFPTLRAFGVRITGKPWIHTIGASTGRVIALTSAHDVAHQSPYHLARVLKHEFTHTVTLEATNNRIPHWFTEGLAVMQEDAPRSFEWCVLLADAVRRDRLFTLESIDWGFIRPRTQHDRPMAYAQSEWMCEYIVERFGYETVNAMLKRFRAGLNQHQVFSEQLGLAEESFDRDFRAWAGKQAAQWGFDISPPEDPDTVRKLLEEQPDDPWLPGRLARAHLDAGELEPAWTAAQSALERYEKDPNALKVLAKIISLRIADIRDDAEKKELDELWLSILQRLDEADPDGWTAPKSLAEVYVRRGELDRAAEMYARLQRVSPMDPASWRGLAGIHLRRGETDAALSQLLELARMEENNAEVPGQIAGLCRQKNRLRDAQYWYRQALCVRPYDVQLHGQLADVSLQADDLKTALRHYRLLTMIEPVNPRHYEKAAFAAHKLGDQAETRRLAEQAVKLDPGSQARSLLP